MARLPIASEQRRPFRPAVLLALAGCGGTAQAPELERAYSVQMHVHGSFSEGVGSIDSHSHEASEIGVDVIWWSDHDFRVTSYRHVTRFGFEAWNEPLERGEAWSPRPDRERFKLPRKTFRRDPTSRLRGAEAVFSEEDPAEGRRSLRLRARGEAAELEAEAYEMAATRDLFRRPLDSELTLSIAIRPEEHGPDARAFVLVGLSEHAPREGLPLTRYALRYVLAEDPGEPRRDGSVLTIPLPFRRGEWNRYALPLTADAVAGFPFLEARDNALHDLVVGVEARRGASVSASFDDLRIAQEHAGAEAYARQRRLIDAVAADYPSLRELQGVEISYTRTHLNELSIGTELLDYDALLAESDEPAAAVRDPASFDAFVARRAVEAAHARGGLVSYNHCFGVSVEEDDGRRSREEVLEKLLESRLFGADLLEVGYRARGGHDLDDHLWVWDGLARAGLRVVATGVSDSHGGPGERWQSGRNRFVSWVYAGSPEKAELIEGLRRGRVFFGDPVLFQGKLDLWTDGGARMGAEVVTDAARATVTIAVEGATAGDLLRVIESGRPVATHAAEGRASFSVRHTSKLAGEGPWWVRAELHDAEEGGKAFSNPIHFLRPEHSSR